MSLKQLAVETIQQLPEDATWQEIEDRIHFMAAVQRGRADVDQGRVVPHEKLRELLAAWTTR